MNKLKINSIEIDDRKIELKNGVNIITGGNATGKTTLFYCFMLGLGISNRNYMNSIDNGFINRIVTNLTIGKDDYTFLRYIKSSEIDVENKNNKLTFSIKSEEYLNFLCKCFNPSFVFEYRKESISQILNYHFVSERTFLNTRRGLVDQSKLVIGIDNSALESYKLTIDDLEKNLKQEEVTNSSIKTYKNRLISHFEKSNYEKDALTNIIGIINSEFVNTYDTLINRNEMLKESKEAYKKIENSVYLFQKLRNSEILDKLNQNLKRFNLVLESMESSEILHKSGGEITIIEFVKRLTLATLNVNYNTPALLLVDDMFGNISNHQITNLYDLINELVEKHDMQIILLTQNNKIMNRNDIIYNLDSGGIGKWN